MVTRGVQSMVDRSRLSRNKEVTDLVGMCEAGVQALWAGGRNSEAEGNYRYQKHKENRYKEYL